MVPMGYPPKRRMREKTIDELVSGSTLKGGEDKRGKESGRRASLMPSLLLLSLISFPGTADSVACRRFYISNRASLDCSSSSLSSLPPLPHDIFSLNLRFNHFPVIDRLPPSYENLLTLRMDYCNISKIDPTALSPLVNLISLDLSHNSLKILSMHPIRSLRTLLLSHNELQYLPNLSHFTSLRMVDLSCNRLVAISSVLLPPRIESLLIKKNALTAIPALPSLSKLQELEIIGNPLSCSCLLHPFLKWSLYLTLFDVSSFPCPLPLPSHCDLSIDGAANLTTLVSTKVIPEEELCCVLHGPRNATFFWEKNERRQVPSRIESIHDGLALRSCFIARSHGLISCRAEYGNTTVSRQFSIEAPPAVLGFEEDILFYLIFSTILLLLLIPSILIINRYVSIPSSSLTTTVFSTPSSPEVSEWESVTPRALLNQPPIARSESVVSIVHSIP